MAAVKAIFSAVGAADKFRAYEAEFHARLVQQIEEQTALPNAVFTSLLQKIYNRSK